MGKLTDERLDEIEHAARNAWTQYPWRTMGGTGPWKPMIVAGPLGQCVVGHATDADAKHIANMDPPTTLALIAELREARAAFERLKEYNAIFNAPYNGDDMIGDDGYGTSDHAIKELKAEIERLKQSTGYCDRCPYNLGAY